MIICINILTSYKLKRVENHILKFKIIITLCRHWNNTDFMNVCRNVRLHKFIAYFRVLSIMDIDCEVTSMSIGDGFVF